MFSWLFGEAEEEGPPEPLVFGARLRCVYGSQPNYLYVEPGDTLSVNNLPGACVEDRIPGVNIKPFGTCFMDGECEYQMDPDEKWTNLEPQRMLANGKEIITTKSFIFCKKYGMKIEPETSGQDGIFARQFLLLAEIEAKYPGLLAILLDPYESLYLNEGMYKKALRFLEDTLEKRGGELEIHCLYRKDDLEGELMKSAMDHLLTDCDARLLEAFVNGLQTTAVQAGIAEDVGWDARVLNAKMLQMLKVDCEETAKRIATQPFYRWSEENKCLLTWAGDSAMMMANATMLYYNIVATTKEDVVWKDTDEIESPGYAKTCFTGDTLILVKQGFKKISEIKPNDKVWAEDIKTGCKDLKQVVRVYRHLQKYFIYIYLKKNIIKTTKEHPFWVTTRGWVLAENVRKGDILKTNYDEEYIVEFIEDVEEKESIIVYNLEVEDWHTYFVSENRILVHNKANLQNKPGWIKHDVYNQVRNRFGQKGVDKFINSMKKGIVSGKGENGIKMFSGKGVEIGGKLYQYEIKVKGGLGDWRVFGNYDSASEHIVFDKFTTGVH
jgi:hypothetical protein